MRPSRGPRLPTGATQVSSDESPRGDPSFAPKVTSSLKEDTEKEPKSEGDGGRVSSVEGEGAANVPNFCSASPHRVTSLKAEGTEGLDEVKEETQDSAYSLGRRVESIPEKWKLLPAFFASRGLVVQHLSSYNHFITHELKAIVRASANRLIKSDVDPAFFIEFLDLEVGEAVHEECMQQFKLTPRVCRVRELSYSAPLLAHVEYYRGNQVVRRKGVCIGYIPVMVRSKICILHGKTEDEIQRLGECPLDPGGYFIVKGTEKVLLMQEQLSKNRIIVELDIKRNICATVTSATAEAKSRTAVVLKGSRLFVRHNSFLDDLPLCIVLRALGLESDQAIAQHIGVWGLSLEALSLSLQDCHSENVMTQEQALQWVGNHLRPRMLGRGFAAPAKDREAKTLKKASDDAVETLHRVLLSHIPSAGSDFRPKAQFLCLMAQRCLEAAEDASLLDDKDYYGNKRLELAGQMLGLLFEDLFKRFCSQTKKQADYALTRYHQTRSSAASRQTASSSVTAQQLQYPDCFRNLPTDIITRGLQTALSTGNWCIKRFRMERSGVSQVLSRLSYIATLGMMCRLNSQFEKGRKVSGPRALQPSQWGVLCPCDTPEGESCGLVKNLALLTHVTTDEPEAPVVRAVFALGVEDAQSLPSLHEVLDGPASAAENKALSPLPSSSSQCEANGRGGADSRRPLLVFLNGRLLGAHRSPEKLLRGVRQLRRRGLLGPFVSIHLNEAHRAVYVATDGGRLSRPLILVKKCQPLLRRSHLEALERGELGFGDLLNASVVEWVDVNEENNLLIALSEEQITPSTTHLEIDPLALLGVVAGLIAFPNHNQSPRNTYQCAMGKQAMGAIAFNQFARSDNLLYLLVYPQKPLCRSRTLDLVRFEQLPAGQNASVAVMSFSGYDIEDALILNRAAVDRGFGRCFSIRRQTVEFKHYYNGAADRAFPPPLAVAAGSGGLNENSASVSTGGAGNSRSCVSTKNGLSRASLGASRRFAVLGGDGLASVGERVEEDQVVVNKFSPVNTKTPIADPLLLKPSDFAPSPVRYRGSTGAYVDRVLLTEGPEGGGARLVKLMLRQTRLPELGDKFSSRHGQKGVVGLIAPQEDLPFAEDGWCPDLIMNPHGFPSRMTVGKLLELLAGKSALLSGVISYGTAFGGSRNVPSASLNLPSRTCPWSKESPAGAFGAALLASGFHYSGKQYLTCGLTGAPLKAYVFCGPIYYQKLKHMVQDKMHARGRGPRQLLTRQPTEGRAKDGGLRLGEMERDCLVAYGASSLLLERLVISSDACDATVCTKCGLLGAAGWCPLCRSGENAATVQMPYACKLLFQELMSMNVCPKLSLREA